MGAPTTLARLYGLRLEPRAHRAAKCLIRYEMLTPSRRDVLKTMCAVPAFAARRSQYRAVVCVFLSGGNDGHNTVVPLRTAAQNYETYRRMRGGLALPERSLLPIALENGEVYGLHPRLESLQRLFREGKVAIAANVGVARRVGAHSEARKEWLTKLDQGVRRPALEEVGKIIPTSARAGAMSDVFCCAFDGFDTHGAQLELQHRALAALDRAIGDFFAAIDTAGLSRQVTLFTASEFGRSIAPNSTDGTDHGWGNHHFIIGGAVNRATMFGHFPRLDSLATPTPVEQYAARVRTWYTENDVRRSASSSSPSSPRAWCAATG